MDNWNAKINVIGNSREQILAGLRAAVAEIEFGKVQSAMSGNDGYTYLAEINKPEKPKAK